MAFTQIALLLSGSLLVSLTVVPLVIWLTNRLRLLDTPDSRKEHKFPTPTMGGLSFTVCFLLFTSCWKAGVEEHLFWTITAAVMVLCITGIVDDTRDLGAGKKLLLEMALGAILVSFGFCLNDLHGILGIHQLTLPLQYLVNMVLVAGLINAFNLIDGINGLAGGLGFINTAVFAWLFYSQGNMAFLTISLVFAGSLLGFLRYNFNKARIFMGDTGSLHLGFMMALFGISAMNGNNLPGLNKTDILYLVVAMWLVPVFDTFRVFSIRILKGKGPFTADKRHVHHLLLKTGMNHVKASLSLYAANMILIASAIILPRINPTFNVLVLVVEAVVLIEILTINRLIKLYKRIRNTFSKSTQIIYGHLYIK